MTSTPRSPLPAPSGDVELLERLAGARKDLLAQVGQRIVGQREVLDGILTAIFSGGHALLVGVPGLAKTLMVQTVAESLDLAVNPTQFTPELMPSDITGTEIIEEDLATGKRGGVLFDDLGAGDGGRQEVRRELDAIEREVERLRD